MVTECHRAVPGIDAAASPFVNFVLSAFTLALAKPSGRYEPEATTWVKIKNRSYSQAQGRDDFFDERARKLAVADLTDGS
jgi:hypothetical protein